MKKKINIKKIIGYTILCILVLYTGSLVYRSQVKDENPDYTSYSTGPKGIKALFLLAERMGYRVERFEKPSKYLPDKATLVAVKPDTDLFNEPDERKYMKEWLERGNTLVLIDDIKQFGQYRINEFKKAQSNFKGVAAEDGILGEAIPEEETPDQEVDDIDKINRIYKVGKGGIIFLGSLEGYTNNGIGTFQPGIMFIDILEISGNKVVLFNEYYHGMSDQAGLSLWDLLGQTGILVVIQVLLCLVILMFHKSRRFGKPVVVYEIEKRKENENLFALSNIYLKAKANGVVLETHFNNLMGMVSKYLGIPGTAGVQEVIDAARNDRFLSGIGAKEVMLDCWNYINQGRDDLKSMVRLVERIEKIRKQLT